MEGPYIPLTGERSNGDKPENDSDTKKKKKDVRVPLPLSAQAKQPVEEPKAPPVSSSDRLEALFKGTVEKPKEKEETKAPPVEGTVEFVPLPPSEIVNEGPARLEPYQAIEAVDIPLSEVTEREHEITFDHPAEDLHHRLQPGRTEEVMADEPPAPEEPHPEFVDATRWPAAEVGSSLAGPAAETAGGDGGHVPPRGPEGPSGPTPEDPTPGEPEGVPESAVATLPDWAPRDPDADGTGPRTEYAPPTAATETHVIHERNGGGALAAIVGVVDWLRGRRLRRTQRQQEKRLTQIERAQAEARDRQQRTMDEQAHQNHLLQEQLAARPTTAELRSMHAQPPAERLRTVETINRHTKEYVPPAPDQIIEEKPVEVPQGHHLEHSAWHAIEVDSKTGRAVEKPAFDYGEEFRREQHQERRRQEEQAAAEMAGYSAVNTALNGGSTGNGSDSSPGGKPLASSQSDKPTLQSIRKQVAPALDTTNVALLITLAIIVLAIIFVLILR